MKEFLIKILNTPITKALLKNLKKWLITKLTELLKQKLEKIQTEKETEN